jgi:hypothetical protein
LCALDERPLYLGDLSEHLIPNWPWRIICSPSERGTFDPRQGQEREANRVVEFKARSMKFWGPGEGSLANLLKHDLFVAQKVDDGILGIDLYVQWDTHSPALRVRELDIKDATLSAIEMLLIEDGDLAVWSESRDGQKYVCGTKVGFRIGAILTFVAFEHGRLGDSSALFGSWDNIAKGRGGKRAKRGGGRE